MSTPAARLLAEYERVRATVLDEEALARLSHAFSLTSFEADMLAWCAVMEFDRSFAAQCVSEAGGGPTLALLLSAVPGAQWGALAPTAPLRYWRLIEVGPGDQLSGSRLRIDERVAHYLTGVDTVDERLLGITRIHRGHIGLPPSQDKVAQRIAALWGGALEAGSPFPAVQLVGAEDVGLTDIAAAACERVGLRLRTMSARDLPRVASEREELARAWEREAILGVSALLIDFDDMSSVEDQTAVAAFVRSCRGALLLASREVLHLPGQSLPRFDVHKPERQEQRSLWVSALREAGASADPADIDRLIDQFDLGPAAIVDAVAGAVASSSPGAELSGAALWEAGRVQARSRLEDLAQLLPSTAGWEHLVLPTTQQETLHALVTQVRHRAKVYDRWGFGARHGRGLGISALFDGPSGTGKTLAAEVIANELGLDLYRIDLSGVVSKYIGETEKNLRRIFDAAETAGAVLLFDEADALFGKRSDVRDSHDRYANIEVSYLLQRMEEYRGLAILTTNMKQALDPAFTRRIRFVVQFPFPDAQDRAEIWRRIFPDATPVADLLPERLAQLNVTGGNIRNIALGAAFLAAEADQPVHMSHVLAAARTEYAKLERQLTDVEIGGWN